MKAKIIRCCTVDSSIDFLRGMIPYLSEHYELLLLSSPGKYLTELSEEYGVISYGVKMERQISPLKDLISLFKLISIFAKERPRMVHSMTPKAGLLCMLASWMTCVPIRVHTFTGLVWPTSVGLKRKLLMATDWLTCACATHVVPEGQGVLNDLRNYGITNKPMKILGYGNIQGVEMDRFARERVIDQSHTLKEKYGLDSCFTFIFVGRIVKDKGINELIYAFDLINQKYPQTRLLLVGRDDNDPISTITRKTIEDNPSILKLGPIYGDDLIAHYVVADCLVFPSYREGFPNTVLEAGALGLPSIVTDINGSREIIIEGENGLIIPSKDKQALYGAMEKMLLNKEMTAKMAKKARRMIESRFDSHFVQQCLYDYYTEIIN